MLRIPHTAHDTAGAAIRVKFQERFGECMPLIKVSMYPGRSEKQKKDFAESVTNSAVEILGTKKEHVIVVFEENPSENWFLAGTRL